MVETSDEWITSRTGVKERRILKGGRATSDMGVVAVKGLCEKRGISPDEIDLLFSATVTPDMPFPATATIICYKAGANTSLRSDFKAAFSGFFDALPTDPHFPPTGIDKKVVLLGANKLCPL